MYLSEIFFLAVGYTYKHHLHTALARNLIPALNTDPAGFYHLWISGYNLLIKVGKAGPSALARMQAEVAIEGLVFSMSGRGKTAD